MLALYISVIQYDTNADGELSNEDDITLALANVDASGYIEIDTGINAILDSSVVDNGKNVSFLLHIDDKVL